MVDQWSYWQAIHLGPAMQRIVFERLLKSKFGMGDPDEKSLEGSLKEVAQFLAVLEANLSDKEWVAGPAEHCRLCRCEHFCVSEICRHVS